MSQIAKKDAKEKKKLNDNFEAMVRRLDGLDTEDNAVVEAALAEDSPEEKNRRYDEWEIVQDLVSAATSKFIDGSLSFKKSVGDLADALQKLASE